VERSVDVCCEGCRGVLLCVCVGEWWWCVVGCRMKRSVDVCCVVEWGERWRGVLMWVCGCVVCGWWFACVVEWGERCRGVLVCVFVFVCNTINVLSREQGLSRGGNPM
jgi:hypothetical protein